MKPAASDGAKRIQALLGDAYHVVEFDESTHSSAEAAAAIGCKVAQIAKSMLYQAADGRGVLIVASGANRVDEKKVAALLGQKITRAGTAFVVESEFIPGGVAPIGHAVKPVTFLDRDLLSHDTIWAAAGSSNAIFRLTPDDLRALTEANYVDVAKVTA